MRNQTKSHTPGGVSIGRIMSIVEDLTGLMSEEVRLLKAMQVREFGALQDRKMELVRAYEAQTDSLRNDPGFIEALSPRIRDELRDVIERMQTVMDENETAITAAREMNHRVARMIVQAVQEIEPANGLYSAEGALTSSPAAPPVSVQVDQSL